MRKRKGNVLLWVIVMLMLGLPAVAWANAPKVTEVRTEAGENRVVYPQVEGLADAEVQKRINDDIIFKADVLSHFLTLGTLREGGWGLIVDYDAWLENDVLSLTINAKGTMPGGREGQRYTALCYDLENGEIISLDQLFHNLEDAASWMEERAEETLSEEFSGYLVNAALSPLPVDNFALDGDGITFYYPAEQFSLLSGYSGACQFYFEEVADFLLPEGILGRLGYSEAADSPGEAKEKITRRILAEGRLPHVPVSIGMEMTEVVEKYRLLREPDQYPGGKYYQLEAPPFRQVLILSDDHGRGYANSKVLGIQTTRGSLYGIEPGKTTREEWRKILGQPESTLEFSENLAYDYSLPVGESDVYILGDYQLRLHGNAEGMLHSIRFMQ